MSAVEIITLVALILTTGGLVSVVFQALKKWLPDNNAARASLCWVFSVVVALAESWLAGDVLGLIGSWTDGTITAGQIFAYGSGLFAAATAMYNAYYKGIKPLVDKARAVDS